MNSLPCIIISCALLQIAAGGPGPASGPALPLSASISNNRACRAAETKDFDDKQGDPAKTWKAVIFNPVPGPPMGPNTRLNFRYRLTGTDSIRVQIYSLSNGYHRQLGLKGLTRDAWQRADIDMTQLRFTVGMSGQFADELKFLIPKGQGLLVDDVLLFEPGD